jgi:hypothetical protein
MSMDNPNRNQIKNQTKLSRKQNPHKLIIIIIIINFYFILFYFILKKMELFLFKRQRSMKYLLSSDHKTWRKCKYV